MNKLVVVFRIVLVFCLMTSAMSCKKDKAPAPATNNSKSSANEEFQRKLGKKWEVQSIIASRQARETGAFEQPWFEFFSGDNSYVVHDNSSIYYGTYNTNDTRDTITLNGFGIITMISLNNSAFDFSLKKEGEANYNLVFTTVVDPTIPSSPATDLLCEKAWTIDWQIPAGADTAFYNSASSGITKIEVRFSKNGTYLNHTETTESFGNSDIVKYWKWNDAAQTQILTSDSDTFEEPTTVIILNTLTAHEWNFSYGTITEGSASR